MTNLNVQSFNFIAFQSGVQYEIINFQAVDYFQQPTTSQIITQIGTPQNPTATPYPIFTSPAAVEAYYEAAQCQILIDSINSGAGATIYTGYTIEYVDTPVNAALSAAITALATVATTGSYADLSNKPTIPTTLSQLSNDAGFITSSALVEPDWNATTGLAKILNKPTIPNATQAYEGTTQRLNAFPIIKSATVASGTATFYLTNDGTATGTALFPNGVIQDSVNITVNDATAAYQMSWAFTNSNKTITVTANKLSTANILTGLLGQVAANAAVVKLSVWGY